jgi:hypothetical protein
LPSRIIDKSLVSDQVIIDSVRIQDTRGRYDGLAILKCLPCR